MKNEKEIKEEFKEITEATKKDLRRITSELGDYFSPTHPDDSCEKRFNLRIYQILHTILIEVLENYVEEKELDGEKLDKLFQRFMELKGSSKFDDNEPMLREHWEHGPPNIGALRASMDG